MRWQASLPYIASQTAQSDVVDCFILFGAQRQDCFENVIPWLLILDAVTVGARRESSQSHAYAYALGRLIDVCKLHTHCLISYICNCPAHVLYIATGEALEL